MILPTYYVKAIYVGFNDSPNILCQRNVCTVQRFSEQALGVLDDQSGWSARASSPSTMELAVWLVSGSSTFSSKDQNTLQKLFLRKQRDKDRPNRLRPPNSSHPIVSASSLAKTLHKPPRSSSCWGNCRLWDTQSFSNSKRVKFKKRKEVNSRCSTSSMVQRKTSRCAYNSRSKTNQSRQRFKQTLASGMSRSQFYSKAPPRDPIPKRFIRSQVD